MKVLERLRFTPALSLVIVSLISAVVLYLIYQHSFLPQSADEVSHTSVTNIFFSVFTIASVGIGLTFPGYEIDQLKDKITEIENNKEIKPEIKDACKLHIKGQIDRTKQAVHFNGQFFIIVIVFSLIGVLINEICPISGLTIFFRYMGIFFSIISMWILGTIWKNKAHLIKLEVSGYDESLKTAIEVSKGDYTKLLPPQGN